MKEGQMLEKVKSIVDKKPMAWVVNRSHDSCADYYLVRKRHANENWFCICQAYKDLDDLGIMGKTNMGINFSIILDPKADDYALCAAAIKIFDEQIQKEINAFYRFVYNEKNFLKYTVDYDIKSEEHMLSLGQKTQFVLKQKDGKLYLNRPRGITTHVFDVEVPMPLSIVLERAAIPFCSK